MTPTRYQIALYKHHGPTHHLCFVRRTTKRELIRLIQQYGPFILETTQMPEDFEFTFRPDRIALNDGWIFGKTGQTERECLQLNNTNKESNQCDTHQTCGRKLFT